MTDKLVKSDNKDRIVRCPTCRGDSQFDSSNASRPFCSARCKSMDLGGWANEEFRIESKNTDGDATRDGASVQSDGA